MVVHFICRGNALRSLIAEAYLNSLKIKNVQVISSGTVAHEYKEINRDTYKQVTRLLKKYGIEKFAKSHYAEQLNQDRPIKGDVVIFMNRIARDECVTPGKLPDKTLIWDITDIGEEGRTPSTKDEEEAYREDIYHEIVQNVDELIVGLNQSRQ